MPFTVSYNITAIDKFSEKVKQMEKSFANLKGKVNKKVDTSKFSTSLNKVNNVTCKIKKNADMIQSKISKVSVNPTSLRIFNRLLYNAGNIASNTAGKIGKIGGGLVGKYAPLLAESLGVYGGLKGDDTIAKARLKLAPLLNNNMSNVNSTISKLRMLANKTGKTFNELADGYRLILEGGLTQKQALKNLPVSVNMSRYTGLEIPEFARMYARVAQGRGAGLAFRMLNFRGVNLYKELYNMRHKGKHWGDLTANQQKLHMIVMDKYTASRNFGLQSFEKVMNAYNKEYLQGMSSKYTQTTYTGAFEKIKTSLSSIATSSIIAVTNLLHLHKALGAVATVTAQVANKFISFSKNHGSLVAGGTILLLFAHVRAFVKGICKYTAEIAKGESKLTSLRVVFSEMLKPISSIVSMVSKLSLGLLSSSKSLDVLGGVLTPNTVGNSERKKIISLASLTHGKLTKESIINDYNNDHKSHVKIDVVAHNSHVKSIMKQNIKGKNVFDINALGQNNYRLS